MLLRQISHDPMTVHAQYCPVSSRCARRAAPGTDAFSSLLPPACRADAYARFNSTHAPITKQTLYTAVPKWHCALFVAGTVAGWTRTGIYASHYLIPLVSPGSQLLLRIYPCN